MIWETANKYDNRKVMQGVKWKFARKCSDFLWFLLRKNPKIRMGVKVEGYEWVNENILFLSIFLTELSN